MISVSMCMIVKNEQDILKRCLDSYAGTYDELIIIDTGSTDNTKEIAKKLAKDYEILKVLSWKECKDIMDSINDIASK